MEGVGSRITLLESLVKGLLPEANLSSNSELQQIGKSLGIPLPILEDTNGTAEEAEKEAAENEEESAIQVIPDQQHQNQYVGPSSSFLFHLKLRRMLGNYSVFEFAMFGNNAADQIFELGKAPAAASTQAIEYVQRRESSNTASDCASPSDAVRDIVSKILCCNCFARDVWSGENFRF